ncbi:hypothetical protein V6N13_098739 [Hibiscus sabdariffa]
MYAGNAPNPYEQPTMAGSLFGNPVDDNFYHPQPPIYHPSMGRSSISNQVDDVFYHSQPPIYHPSMGGSSVSNQVDDIFYHPQPPIYHPSMGGSSGVNFFESYVPDFCHSQTLMYPSFGGNIDYQEIIDFMTVTSISSTTFSPHISDYAWTTPAPMRHVIGDNEDDDDDDDDDDDAPQRPQRDRRPPRRYDSTTSQHGQKLHRR